MPNQRVERIELPEGLAPPSAFAAADRDQAVRDLLVENRFDPPGLPPGPYGLRLDLREGRLWLGVEDAATGAAHHAFALALGPFRRLIKDYLMIVESHELAVAGGDHEMRVQAIDMGRRGLHDEGAALLMERLDGRVSLDHATARRLFTLVCALHHRV